MLGKRDDGLPLPLLPLSLRGTLPHLPVARVSFQQTFHMKLSVCSGVSRLCIKGHLFLPLVLLSGRWTTNCARCGVTAQSRARPVHL